ncbi:hypothetical protein ACFT5B_05165 [Luteimicrobium sp. NPDC057192]|uniref:hypothetical protein n=1 Tax=Luteimicrobium sp. NPDC057192 TaxID=3346042 RepID=UPI00362B95DE
MHGSTPSSTTGRRVVLLDDRGWSTSDPPGTWDRARKAELEETARVVVGPDEPVHRETYDEAATQHCSLLAWVLDHAGTPGDDTPTDPTMLAALPHDVVLDQRLLARVGR